MDVGVSGPGTQTTNAGFTGGDFGLEGFAKGLLTAALVNIATTKITTNTFLYVATSNTEAIFHFNNQEPSTLRLVFSNLFVAAEKNKRNILTGPISLSDEFIKLQSLKESGILSEDEFITAKQRLLKN